MIIEAVAINVLFLEQTLDANMKAFTVEQLLVFSERLDKNMKPQQLHSLLLFSEKLVLEHDTILVVEQTLNLLQDNQPKAIVQDVTQYLILAQDLFYGDHLQVVSQSLVIEQQADVLYCKGTTDTFAPSDEAVCVLFAAPQVGHNFSMLSTAAAYKPSKNWLNGEFTVEAP